ncbi:MAG: lipoprotein [Bacteroidota bacterium]
MLNAKQILIRLLVLAASVLNLVACGQTGDLYLPSPNPTPKPAPGTAAAPAPAQPTIKHLPTP